MFTVGKEVSITVRHNSALLESLFGKQPTSKTFKGVVVTGKGDDPDTVRITSDDPMVECRVIYFKTIISVDGKPFTYAKPTDKPVPRTYEVPGSKGDKYTVTVKPNGTKHCTCKGFGFRHHCKHIEAV